MENAIMTEISKSVTNTFTQELGNQIKDGRILKKLIGSEGIYKPNFTKEIWIGTFLVTVHVHS